MAISTAPRRVSLPATVPSAVELTTNGLGWVWKAPISGGESSGKPRWSVVTPGIVVPLPMAGLPASNGTVHVAPPLFLKVPRPGSATLSKL